jgi:hypothetical protein
MLSLGQPDARTRALVPLCLGGLLAASLTLPYALPYLANTRELGPRPAAEVAMFSAQWGSYASAPAENWLWGWTAWGFSGNERHLFPGVTAVTLALIGFAWRPRRLVWMYAALTLLALELSLGLNGALYRWLYDHIFAFRGFRAPARFAILACCTMSIVAAYGFLFLERRLLAGRPARRLLLVVSLIAIGVESGSSPLALAPQSTSLPPVYKYLQTLAPSVMVEFPLTVYDPTYMFWSTYHWHSLVNGYSGYTPGDVVETRALLETFPDDRSIARLRALKVRYILVHQAFFQRDDFSDLMTGIAQQPQLIPAGRYRDWVGADTQLFELKR